MRKALQNPTVAAARGRRENVAPSSIGPTSLAERQADFTIEQVIQQLTRMACLERTGNNPVPDGGLGTISYAFFDFRRRSIPRAEQFSPLTARSATLSARPFCAAGRDRQRRLLEGVVATADIISAIWPRPTIIIRPMPAIRPFAQSGGYLVQPEFGDQSAGRPRPPGFRTILLKCFMRSASPIRAITMRRRA